MSLPEPVEEDFVERRRRLSAEIARQRADFSQAYARLEHPIRYADYGIRGLGFLRSNPWIFAAAPAAVSIIKTLLSGAAPKLKKSPNTHASSQTHAPAKGRLGQTVSLVANNGWRLFQLYRRIRSYLP
jgi:hypothetical protein